MGDSYRVGKRARTDAPRAVVRLGAREAIDSGPHLWYGRVGWALGRWGLSVRSGRLSSLQVPLRARRG